MVDLKRRPGETHIEYCARLAQRRREGCPRTHLLNALWRAGMLRSVPPPPITQH